MHFKVESPVPAVLSVRQIFMSSHRACINRIVYKNTSFCIIQHLEYFKRYCDVFVGEIKQRLLCSFLLLRILHKNCNDQHCNFSWNLSSNFESPLRLQVVGLHLQVVERCLVFSMVVHICKHLLLMSPLHH